MENPFLAAFHQGGFNTPDQCIPFHQIRPEHFLPAMEDSRRQTQARVNKIKTSPAGFESTIVALENCAEEFELISGVYQNLFGAEGTPEIQALAQEVSAQAAALSSEILLDGELFAKVKEVFESKEAAQLETEAKMLLEKTYRQFARNGALLPSEKKEKLRALDQELAKLSPLFSENVLKATNAFTLVIDRREDLAGLPEGAVEAAAFEAKKRGLEGKWVFTLHQPSLQPFLKFSDRRDLREKLFLAYGSRSFGGEFDNQDVLKKIVKLRHERAQLLGFKTHANFVLEERMAEDPRKVMDFLQNLFEPSKKAADREIKELSEFARKTHGIEQLMPWDVSYYAEKLRQEKYAFNSEELRPYFPLERVIEGVFAHAEKLYGLVFNKRPEVPVYHSDVVVYEVRDRKTNDYVGLFYTDFFPRETKRNGAWMTVYREQGLFAGVVRRPHVSIVCNFTQPTPTKPSLLSFEEVTTLFHEFGHALHGLLSQCHYRSVAGTNVYWDFVELPSQVMENWAREKEGLDLFARHYQTGEKIPMDLFERMKKAEKFMAGYNSLRQLSFGFLDMGWHSTDPENIGEVARFEKELLEKTRLLPEVAGVNLSCSFSHIFAGGYSAGYYSYKWAEVLDADAFEAFKEKGLFHGETAEKFRAHILSRGGTEHPMDLYKRFRGREPDPRALLRKYGLDQ